MAKIYVLVLLFLVLQSPMLPQQAHPEKFSITLERNPGFFGFVGTADCPFYKLTIEGDGKVEVQPKKYGKTGIETGKTIQSQITTEQLKQIVDEFEKVKFDSLKSTFEIKKNRENNRDDCPQYTFDAGTVFVSITRNSRFKQVEHYQGCRGNESLSKLSALEDKIDEIVNIKQWFDCYHGENRVKHSFQNDKQ